MTRRQISLEDIFVDLTTREAPAPAEESSLAALGEGEAGGAESDLTKGPVEADGNDEPAGGGR